MEFSFTVITKLTLENDGISPVSKGVRLDLRFEVSNNLDMGRYLDNNRLPRKEAMLPIMHVLTSALAAHMRACAQKGWASEGEMMTKTINALQDVFMAQGDVSEGTMNI